MLLTRLTRRKLKAIGYYEISWLLVITGFSLLVQYGYGPGLDIGKLLFAIQFGIFMGLVHGIYDVIILQDEMDHRSALLALFIRSLFFVTSVSTNLILCILLWHIHGKSLINIESLTHVQEAFQTREFQTLFISSFIFGHAITFIKSVQKKFGIRVFVNTVLGKYQDPTEEDLVFMFIDLKKSTAIAEELGHVNYSNFIKDYYRYLSNCCEENHGKIYQIAGDGAILTWETEMCHDEAHPINCFYDFTDCLDKTKQRFIKKYGIAPQFKAGAHCGKVISAEVGNFGSEMAYHGDAINATSRIEGLCSKLGKDLLVSEELYKILPKPFPHDFYCQKEGFFELRGRKKEILIFSLQRPLTID